jgi:hypothetical protein
MTYLKTLLLIKRVRYGVALFKKAWGQESKFKYQFPTMNKVWVLNTIHAMLHPRLHLSGNNKEFYKAMFYCSARGREHRLVWPKHGMALHCPTCTLRAMLHVTTKELRRLAAWH